MGEIKSSVQIAPGGDQAPTAWLRPGREHSYHSRSGPNFYRVIGYQYCRPSDGFDIALALNNASRRKDMTAQVGFNQS
jgi:hypothetical protein